jgi:flagellar hook-length control protein FliK
MKQVILFAALVLASLSNKAQSTDALAPVVAQYMLVKDALVADDAAAAATQATALLKTLENTKMDALKKDAKAIAATKDIKKQRAAFSSLSASLYTLVKTTKPETTIYYQNCPMYNSGKGGNWLSLDNEIKNPFYGDMMLTCGSTVETIQK